MLIPPDLIMDQEQLPRERRSRRHPKTSYRNLYLPLTLVINQVLEVLQTPEMPQVQ